MAVSFPRRNGPFVDISEGPLQRDVLLESQSSGLHRGTDAWRREVIFSDCPLLKGQYSAQAWLSCSGLWCDRRQRRTETQVFHGASWSEAQRQLQLAILKAGFCGCRKTSLCWPLALPWAPGKQVVLIPCVLDQGKSDTSRKFPRTEPDWFVRSP